MDIEITQNIIDYIIDNRSRFEMDIPKLGEKWNVESITTYSGVNCGNPVVELSNDNKDWMVLPKELLYQQLENMLEESLSNETTESWNKRLEEAAKKYCKGSSFEDACIEKPAYMAGAKWSKEQDMQKGANYVIEEIEKIINHPLKFVNANKTVEDGMIEEISKLVEQLKKYMAFMQND